MKAILTKYHGATDTKPSRIKQVTEKEFFAKIGPMDVHPRVDATTLHRREHVSSWEHRHTREVVGMSKSDSHAVNPTQFFLTEYTIKEGE